VTTQRLFAAAALCAAIAIAAGAFGSHGATGRDAELLKTGALYQLIHAVAVFAFAGRFRGPATVLLAGSGVFAFSLYALALGAPRWFGAIAPLGGTAMIVGWLWIAYRASMSRNASTSESETDLST
jgi:uncharacterized membrane protein YgdD (TMEM256/DUF423 family)